MTSAALAGGLGERNQSGMDPNDLRIGDAEREQTMAALREHFAAGRLNHEELDERLDQTLAARTVGELVHVTADLPGSQVPGYREPAAPHDANDWREAMRAQRKQMRALHHQHREAHHRGRPGPPWRGHHGPGPILPFLFVLVMLGLIFGGAGVFKVLFFVWISAMIFTFVSRRLHRHRRD
ncbi:hypothetical protein GCM10012278_46150 [Nonomuraea glycinis]|uniref:DUF1707 domain-containing protein n=2 Tax=Nonomuraea glycinis TaxID=2047744 RepID=A0A918A806_9ACTN|nr:hypothetical protein GCM10012278_46150 [Nonomuraea glycinis]